MSADRTTTEYYLCLSGWTNGTLRCYGETNEVIERPQDAIETWVLRSEQSSCYAPTLSWWEDQATWINPEVLAETREKLKVQFPRPPAPVDNFQPYKKKKRSFNSYSY